jgi:YD repeat-containing protein
MEMTGFDQRSAARNAAAPACLRLLVGLSFFLTLGVPQAGAKPGATAGATPSTLLTPIGTLSRDVSEAEVARWKRELRREDLRTEPAARLHLWLGEVEIARNKEPERALEQFRLAQHLVRRSSPVYGCAAYDRAVTLFYQGAYSLAAPAFRDLLALKSRLHGYSRSDCALWARHAAACAGYHAQHARLGITEPSRLDPLCGVASLAACMRAHDRPYDRTTLLTHCRMTGLGNNMQDLARCAKRLGMSAWTVKADEEGLKRLPKPLVAYVEQDHFVAVTRADNDGVSYLCSDCGAWPGGRRDLSWKQWRAMECNLFLAVATPGSAEARLMTSALSTRPTGRAVASAPATRLAALRANDLPSTRTLLIRLLKAHSVLYVPPISVQCGQLPNTQHCNPDAQCCAGDGGGAGGGGGDGSGGGGGGNDGGYQCGPSDGDPVDLATGEENYSPAADLTVYNPIGPSVVWRRQYVSLRGLIQVPSGLFPYAQYAFGLNWNTAYDMQMIVANNIAYLYLPNGSDYAFDVPATPTAATPQVVCPAANAGVPVLCTWNYNADGSYSFVFTRRDRTQWVFSSLTGYALTQQVDRNGNAINFVYSTPGGPGFELTSITDSNHRTLLTLHHNAFFNVTSVSDRYGRSVYYTVRQFQQSVSPNPCDELTQVSQIVRTDSQIHPSRFSYGYTLHSNGEGEPMLGLHTITVPAPTGKGTATATINYSGLYVGNLVDANGNTRTYTPLDANDTQVTVTDRTGKVAYSYTVGFDAQMRTTYRTDGTGQTQTYQASYLPDNAYQPASVTNANSQTTTYTYDTFGQITSVTSPRNVTTTYTFDYSAFPLGELKQVQEGSKSPITITYYEPSGLLKTLSTPLPGTSGSTQTVTTSFTYDGLGNILSVQLPGNDAAATITRTLNYSQDGKYTQPSAINQPLTVTDNLGHITHFRYDTQGNRVAVWDAPLCATIG